MPKHFFAQKRISLNNAFCSAVYKLNFLSYPDQKFQSPIVGILNESKGRQLEAKNLKFKYCHCGTHWIMACVRKSFLCEKYVDHHVRKRLHILFIRSIRCAILLAHSRLGSPTSTDFCLHVFTSILYSQLPFEAL